ncbi:MAG: hypothetical protein LKE36_06020 [Bacilli bacterium]|jgi:hypothetical protein|nr:hypothetical protein [Bacilli bacterium]
MFAKAKHELQIVNQYKNSSVNLLTVKDKLESTKITGEKVGCVFDTTLDRLLRNGGDFTT